MGRQDTGSPAGGRFLSLFGPAGHVRAEAREVLRRAGGAGGHIFNLGHGVLPETPVENVELLIAEVHEYGRRQ